MKRLYVFGNEYLAQDNLARKVSESLKNIEIIHCRDPSDLLEAEGDIDILDVVKNIKEPVVIHGVENLKTRNIISLHDFDLSFFLKLLEELGIGKDVRIIGIPMSGDAVMLAQKVEALI